MTTDTTTPPDLVNFDITVRMSRKGVIRDFTFPAIPAIDEEHAMKAGYQLGLGVNDASGHQWKFNGAGDEHFVTVARVEDAS